MKQQIHQLLFWAPGVVLALAAANPAFAGVACGDMVSGNVVLTQDLNCTGPGLKVAADNTVINLNGHKIKCTGNGYYGSCQTMSNAAGGGSWAGIQGFNRYNVTIQGPGSIDGFEKGIEVAFGRFWTITGVTVTGPVNPPYHWNQRGPSTGISVYLVGCDTGFNFRPIPSTTISDNNVTNHSTGIHLMADACLLVKNNTVYENSGGTGASYGINILAGNNNTIYNNVVWGNGNSGAADAAINLVQGTNGNHLTSNTVTATCGDGIAVRDYSYKNVIQLNSAILNPYTAADGRCPAQSVASYDLLDTSGSQNTWNTNNLCKHEGGSVPSNVCNPTE